MQLNGYMSTARSLVQLGDYYEFSYDPVNEDCLTLDEILQCSDSRQGFLFHQSHSVSCPRCRSWLSLFRGIQSIEKMSGQFCVEIQFGAEFEDSSHSQLLGHIGLVSLEHEACEEQLFWLPKPTSIRTNLVVDSELRSISLTLLEVPAEIERISITVFDQIVDLEPSQPEGAFEYCFFDETDQALSDETVFSFFQRAFDGERVTIQFAVSDRDSRAQTIANAPLNVVFEEYGAFERNCEYVFPSGINCGVHFNLSKLCGNDAILVRLATEVERKLDDEIDVLVANSWAMAMVARRIGRIRNLRNGEASVRDVLCEQHCDGSVLTDVILEGERVAIVSDVAVRGSQIKAIIQEVEKKKGVVVSVGVIVTAKGAEFDFGVEAVRNVDLEIQSNNSAPATKPRMHFNSLASAMTIKKTAREPSRFVREDNDAIAVWEFIDRVVNETKGTGVQYYKRHHIDPSTNTHYTQFVDTGRLLAHPRFGDELMERVRDKLAEQSVVPEILIVPSRKRARLFADKLVGSFDFSSNNTLTVVVAEKDQRGFWHFPSGARESIRGKRTLIVDTAVGSGKTADLFGMAAAQFGATKIGVCTILSRLPESAELAFSERFSGGFFRLFNLPIRPVVIRGASKQECPYCYRIETLKRAAEMSGSAAIQQLSILRKRFVASKDPGDIPDKQLALFSDAKTDDIFKTCTPTVAGGITLHSLYAAQNNGMATLILPEVRDDRIPARNREAMLQDLPIGALQWSHGDLDNDILESLETVDLPSLWGAGAVALSSERYSNWFFCLKSVVERSMRLKKCDNDTFWQRIAYSAYMTSSDLPESEVNAMTSSVKELIKTHSGSPAANGLQKVLESIPHYNKSELAIQNHELQCESY